MPYVANKKSGWDLLKQTKQQKPDDQQTRWSRSTIRWARKKNDQQSGEQSEVINNPATHSRRSIWAAKKPQNQSLNQNPNESEESEVKTQIKNQNQSRANKRQSWIEVWRGERVKRFLRNTDNAEQKKLILQQQKPIEDMTPKRRTNANVCKCYWKQDDPMDSPLFCYNENAFRITK